MSDLPTPNDRVESLLMAILTGDGSDLPTPRTRTEKLLMAIYENGGTGGGGEGVTPAQVKTILLANTDTALNGASSNPIANKALVDALADYVKSADLSIPTKVSELTNDKKYQTDSDLVTALTPYAKSDDVTAEIIAEIAKVVAGAPESFDTLKEMSDWIAHHEDDATAMNSAISDNKNAIDALQDGKADKIEIPTTVAELTDSADYAKTTDIPETLPADGGNSDTVNNHTVETNVPADAKFTDTIYDDTEVKESIDELNSNLSQLKFDEVAGGKNIAHDIEYTSQTEAWKPIAIGYAKLIQDIEYTMSFTVTSNGSGKMYIPSSSGFESGNPVILINSGTTRITRTVHAIGNDGITKSVFISTYEGNSATISITDFMIEEGTTATPYEPYIPSVKMLVEENAQQSIEAMDLKMLGWTVPSECPVQNYVDSDGVFHQRVGRVDLSTLEKIIGSDVENGEFIFFNPTNCAVNNNQYSSIYNCVNWSEWESSADKVLHIDRNGNCYIKNKSYNNFDNFISAMKGQYLYYELAEEILIKVDGNEAVTKVNESLRALGKCKNLLNPTLQTDTQNGVTCTNNGDGTYTVNGTATTNTWFTLGKAKLYGGRTYRLCGLNKVGNSTLYIQLRNDNIIMQTTNNGIDVSITETSENYLVVAFIPEKTTYNNVIYKPMITTDLNATYDDFVPYTGDGETLTHDVAELKNDLSGIKFYDENGDFIIEHSNGDNISRLIMRANGTIDVQTLYNGNWKEATILSR